MTSLPTHHMNISVQKYPKFAVDQRLRYIDSKTKSKISSLYRSSMATQPDLHKPPIANANKQNKQTKNTRV